MNKCLLIGLFILLQYIYAQGQDYTTCGGPRSAGMGYASVVLADVNAAFYNAAGLADLKELSVSAFSENRFLMKELATHAFVLGVPIKDKGVFALNASYFGYNLFNRKKIGLAYARRLAKNISAGVQADYFSTSIADGYGTVSVFTFDLGMKMQVTEKLIAATKIFNPIRANIADYNDEKIPAIITLGLGYKFNDKVIVTAESEKNLDADFTFRAGIEYHVTKPFYLRAGINSNPSLPSFGFGFRSGKFSFDLSSSYHQVLGYSPVAGITYGSRN